SVEYMKENPSIRAAFVSTNSITQGEQVGILWPSLFKFGVHINFAHRTFQWLSEARGKAAVHCVILGFALENEADKWLFEYETVQSEPHIVKAKNINPYLIDAADVFLTNRSEPICSVPAMRFGSMPRDGGYLILSSEEKEELLSAESAAAKFIRPYSGAEEFLNGSKRWCLWLLDANPDELKRLPMAMKRVEKVREFRLKSTADTTRKLAATPTVFCQLAQPEDDYLLVPRVSSERRKYIPIGFVSKELIANDQVLTVAGASIYHFGVMSSEMHMAWARHMCGRLKSDYRYSKDIVYNNFPWPEPTPAQKQFIEIAAQAVLDARAKFPKATLAELYDPLTMPPELTKAHQTLDRAMDAAYGAGKFENEAQRVAFLFGRYKEITEKLEVKEAPKKKMRKVIPNRGRKKVIKKEVG
ncbi:MAG: type IIL restriction-modification enzyme MmeI, partial [Minisyncoccia bacterium]